MSMSINLENNYTDSLSKTNEEDTTEIREENEIVMDVSDPNSTKKDETKCTKFLKAISIG